MGETQRRVTVTPLAHLLLARFALTKCEPWSVHIADAIRRIDDLIARIESQDL